MQAPKYRRRAAVTLIAIVTCTAPSLSAQRREPSPQPPEATRTVVVDDRDAHATREKLEVIFQQYPPSLKQVFRLDPSLLTNLRRRQCPARDASSDRSRVRRVGHPRAARAVPRLR